jgi:hypothetical protein
LRVPALESLQTLDIQNARSLPHLENGHLRRLAHPAATGLLEPTEHPPLSPKHVIVLKRELVQHRRIWSPSVEACVPFLQHWHCSLSPNVHAARWQDIHLSPQRHRAVAHHDVRLLEWHIPLEIRLNLNAKNRATCQIDRDLPVVSSRGLRTRSTTSWVSSRGPDQAERFTDNQIFQAPTRIPVEFQISLSLCLLFKLDLNVRSA